MKLRFKLALLAFALVAGMAGYGFAQDYPYYGDRYGRDDYYRHEFREGMRVAQEIGYRDGSEVARQDMWRGKRFNPTPRGRYDDANHGYRREFGNKHEYREHYMQAYRDGYMSIYRDRDDRYYDRRDRDYRYDRY